MRGRPASHRRSAIVRSPLPARRLRTGAAGYPGRVRGTDRLVGELPALDHLGPGSHVCCVVDSAAQFEAWTADYLAEGARYGQKPFRFAPGADATAPGADAFIPGVDATVRQVEAAPVGASATMADPRAAFLGGG